eukprot:14616-Heterococcus_DN1.PRE.6
MTCEHQRRAGQCSLDQKQFELKQQERDSLEVYVADCSAYLDKHDEVRASDSLHKSVAIIARSSARRTA